MTAADVFELEDTRPEERMVAEARRTAVDVDEHAEPESGPVAAGRSAADVAVIAGLAVLLWVAVVFLGRLWGQLLDLQGRRLVLFTPPLLGGYREAWSPALLLPVPVAVAGIALLPRWARRLRWPAMCAAGVAGALVWGVVLAVIDGSEGLIAGLEWNAEYGPAVAQMRAGGVGRWLADFTAAVPTAGIQIRAHPPGMPLVLFLLDLLGLSGPWWAATFILAVALSAVVAVLLAVRELCGEDVARRAMPFVALAPAVVFVFTSYDAFYMGVSAWFVTTLVFAARRSGRAADAGAVAAGVLAAVAVMGSYGMVLMAFVPLAVVIRARAWRAVGLATATALLCSLAFVPFGFWWLSGLAATHTAYYALGLDRPLYYFLINAFAALALVVGPAVAAGLAVNRDRRMWMLVGGAVAAVVVADITGLSTGEVERIWLPFALWLLPVGAVLVHSDRSARTWLALQAACPIVLVALIRPYW